MANSDYTARAGGYGFCPMALLANAIGRLDNGCAMVAYTSPVPNGIVVGTAAAIGGEIVVINGHTGDNLLIGRGCCDTIPVEHAAGERIWFFDNAIGTDKVEYAGSETIGVKVLPKTSSAPYVAIANAPAVGITFNFRFARPYPPGLVQANGKPWYQVAGIANTDGLTITWAHRDRVTQQDQLVDHLQASIGPEVGTTYTIRVFDSADTLKRTVADIAGTSWTYEQADVDTDFGGEGEGYVTLESVRGGLTSYQYYIIPFSLSSVADPYGLGYRLGDSLGGIPL